MPVDLEDRPTDQATDPVVPSADVDDEALARLLYRELNAPALRRRLPPGQQGTLRTVGPKPTAKPSEETTTSGSSSDEDEVKPASDRYGSKRKEKGQAYEQRASFPVAATADLLLWLRNP